MRRATALLALVALAGCGRPAASAPGRDPAGFPLADRPVAPIVSAAWSTERDRDAAGDAAAVVRAAGVKPGMSVADVGAGEGYLTVRLVKAVGPKGRVLAEDIMPATIDALAQRIGHDRLDTVSVKLGRADDPMLPEGSFDRIFLVHMYHEIASPYAFLWRLRPALAGDGLVAIVDADRPTNAHGTPPKLLACELKAVGYALVSRTKVPQAGGYLALFRAEGPRPAPAAIATCRG